MVVLGNLNCGQLSRNYMHALCPSIENWSAANTHSLHALLVNPFTCTSVDVGLSFTRVAEQDSQPQWLMCSVLNVLKSWET